MAASVFINIDIDSVKFSGITGKTLKTAMSQCKVCSRYSQNNPLTSFFRFPKDPTRCEIWAAKCNLLAEFKQLSSLHFYKCFRICSDHFQSSYTYWDGKKKRLLPSAIPEISLTAKRSTVPANASALGLDSQIAREIDEMLACNDAEFRLQMIEHLCRLCGEERHILISIFGPRGKSLELPNKLKYIPLKFFENDVLPLKICGECLKKIEENFSFISKCLEADEKLRIILDMEEQNTAFKPVPPEVSFASGSASESELKTMSGMKPPAVNCTTESLLSVSGLEENPESNSCPPRTLDLAISLSLQHDYSNIWTRQTIRSELSKNEKKPEQQRKTFHCSTCNKSFSTVQVQEAHSKAHGLVKRSSGDFACDECGAVLRSRHLLCAHRRRHFGERPFKCSKCQSCFYEFSLLKQHCLTHLPKRFSCDVCNKGFLRKSKLISHLKMICHSELADRNTAVPSQALTTGGPEKESKTGEVVCPKQYKCLICRRSFETLANLSRHWKSHWNRRKYLCAECGKRFTRMDSLKNHNRTHTGERPFSCSTCGFAFKQRGDCKKHEANHQKSNHFSEPRI